MREPNSYPMISGQWQIRNEGNQVVLVLLSTTEARMIRLQRDVALILTLMDGLRTFAEIEQTLASWFPSASSDDIARRIERVLADLALVSQGHPVIVTGDAPATAPRRLESRDFIIPVERYRPSSRLSTPASALIYLTGACHTNCVYCYADTDNLRSYRPLPRRDWERILADLRAAGVRNLTFCGGDCGAHPDYAEVVADAVRRDFVFSFSTKCLVTAEAARLIADAGFSIPVNGAVEREFQLSIDALDCELNRRMVGVPDFLGRVESSVRNLLAAGIHPRVKSVLTPFNADEPEALVAHFASLGVRRFSFARYAPSFHRHDASLNVDGRLGREIARRLTALQARHPELEIAGDACTFSESESPRTEQLLQWKKRGHCSAGRTSLVVAPDGSVLLCEQLTADRKFVVGNLTRQSVREVWESEALLRMTHPEEALFHGTMCAGCGEFAECVHFKGQCFRDNWFAFGTLYHPQKTCPRFLVRHSAGASAQAG